jgi:type IV pilus assembly protein PilA
MINNSRTRQNGFTLIELMIVVAIVGILGTVAFPAYQDYAIRSQVSEAISLAGAAKTAITEVYMQSGKAPANRTAAGLSAIGSDTAGAYVSALDIKNGVITATFSSMPPQRAHTGINAKTLTFVPFLSTDGGVSFKCRALGSSATTGSGSLMTGSADSAGSLEGRYAPQECRL